MGPNRDIVYTIATNEDVCNSLNKCGEFTCPEEETPIEIVEEVAVAAAVGAAVIGGIISGAIILLIFVILVAMWWKKLLCFKKCDKKKT